MVPISKRWLRLSLRTLLIGVTLVCLWLGLAYSPAARQRAAVRVIEEAGGSVTYATRPDELQVPQLLLRVLGPHYFTRVTGVRLVNDFPRPTTSPQPHVTEFGAGPLGGNTALGYEPPLSREVVDDFFKALGRLPAVTEVRLGGWGFVAEDYGRLAPLANRLTRLEVLENSPGWGFAASSPLPSVLPISAFGSANFFRGFDRLEQLRIRCPGLAAGALDSLQTLPRLRRIELCAQVVEEEHLASVLQCKTLESFQLDTMNLRRAQVRMLTESPRFEKLSLNARPSPKLSRMLSSVLDASQMISPASGPHAIGSRLSSNYRTEYSEEELDGWIFPGLQLTLEFTPAAGEDAAAIALDE